PAPITALHLSPAVPNGSGGWYRGTFPSASISRDIAGTTFWHWDGASDTSAPDTAAPVAAPALLDGVHTLHYWSVSAEGTTETPEHTGSVKFDGTPPTALVTVSGGATVTAVPTVTVEVAVTDAASGPGAFAVSADGGASFAATLPATQSSTQIALPGANGEKTIVVRYTDAAGNRGADETRTIALAVPKPTQPTSAGVKLLSVSTALVSWALDATPRDSVVIERRVDAGTWTALPALSAAATTYSDTTLVAGHTYTYRVRTVRDGLYSDWATTGSVSRTSLSIAVGSTARRGRTFTIWGYLTPGMTGNSVYLRLRAPGRRTYVSIRRVTTSSGRWSYSYHTHTAGVAYFYAIYAAAAGRTASTSRVVHTHVR
ncbi:MAG: fibronectin type III domain-containing protein, partial [Coriobacteriia bacterium]|nr:fibronectin type III domain-containing protein [Coriobacteriia bacterium]